MNTQQSIAKIRKLLDMTTRSFGQAVGISHGYVAQLESGVRTPSDSVADKIMKFAHKHGIKVNAQYKKRFSSFNLE